LAGGFTGILSDGDYFGFSAAGLGDVNGDDFVDVMVGAMFDDDGGSARGAVYTLCLLMDGTVLSHSKISDLAGGFTGILSDGDRFGFSAAGLGDMNGDDFVDVMVGAYGDGSARGAVYTLFLLMDGTVSSHSKISDLAGGFTGILSDSYRFGASVANLGDVNGDGFVDVMVGAYGDDDGVSARGAVYTLFLLPDGTVLSHSKISDLAGGFTGILSDGDYFGFSAAGLGDVNGDGFVDVMVGAMFDDDGGYKKGAVYVLFVPPAPRWMNKDVYESLADQFYSMDHDGNSIVNRAEVIRGYKSAGGDLDGDLYIPESYTCIPSTEAQDFTDCITIHSRHEYKRHTYSKYDLTETLSFDDLLNTYFGTCDDLMPPHSEYQYCSDMLYHDNSICYDESPYCRVSCMRCPPSLFDGRVVTGADHVVKTHAEYYHTPGDASVRNYADYQEHISTLATRKSEKSVSYTLLSTSTNSCRDETGRTYRRMNEAECRAMVVSGFTGSRFGGVDNDANYPRGCYLYTPDNEVWFNPHSSGSRRASSRPVCLREGGSTTGQCAIPPGPRGNVHVFSDNHLEPWYEVNPSATGRYSRFSGATLSNMFQCRRAGSSSQVPCQINTVTSAPAEFTDAAIEYMASRALNSDVGRTLLVFGGDTTVHSATTGHNVRRQDMIGPITDRMVRKMLAVGYRAENIIMANGNHDPTMTSGRSSRSIPYTDVLENRGIVTNALGRSYSYGGSSYSTTALFRQTGYYMKSLSTFGSEVYGIAVNTNLGSAHGLQQFALTQDLNWVRNRGGSVILVGHHPSTLPNMVDLGRFGSTIGAGISGHTHSWRASNSNRFMTAPALTPMPGTSGMMISTMSSNGRVTFGNSQLHRYGGSAGKRPIANFLPSPRCWGQ
jgi:hypothetical protein